MAKKNKIILFRKGDGTIGPPPDLDYGELAVDGEGNLYVGKADGSVAPIQGGGGGNLTLPEGWTAEIQNRQDGVFLVASDGTDTYEVELVLVSDNQTPDTIWVMTFDNGW